MSAKNTIFVKFYKKIVCTIFTKCKNSFIFFCFILLWGFTANSYDLKNVLTLTNFFDFFICEQTIV